MATLQALKLPVAHGQQQLQAAAQICKRRTIGVKDRIGGTAARADSRGVAKLGEQFLGRRQLLCRKHHPHSANGPGQLKARLCPDRKALERVQISEDRFG